MHIKPEELKITNKKNTAILDLSTQLLHICLIFCVQLVKEISCKVYYQIHSSLPMIPTLSQVETVPMLPSYFCKILFNITPPMPKSLKQSFSSRLSYQNPLCISPVHHVCCIPSLHNSTQHPIAFSSVDSNWEVASIPWTLSSPNFCMNEIFVTVYFQGIY